MNIIEILSRHQHIKRCCEAIDNLEKVFAELEDGVEIDIRGRRTLGNFAIGDDQAEDRPVIARMLQDAIKAKKAVIATELVWFREHGIEHAEGEAEIK